MNLVKEKARQVVSQPGGYCECMSRFAIRLNRYYHGAMNRHLLVVAFVILLAGCGSEADLPIESKEPESTEPTDKHALYRAEIEKAHELVRQAARLMDSIVSPADARAACAELDKLSDKVIVVADEIARIGVDNSRSLTYQQKRMKFFATKEKLRGSLVPLQVNDRVWQIIKPKIDRFYHELTKLKLDI